MTRLAPSGSSLMFSAYLGGTHNDRAWAVALDETESVYVTGDTNSSDFPTKAAVAPALSGAFDAYVTKLTAAGAVVYSTFLGGSKDEQGQDIAVNAAGAAYVVGQSDSTDLPVRGLPQSTEKGGGDAFLAKLNPAGSALVYATYLGGSATFAETAYGVAVDAAGTAYVGGATASQDFPLSADAFQSTTSKLAGNIDGFLSIVATAPLITPRLATVPPLGAQAFIAHDGTGAGYTWTLATNASGGSIDGSGHYTAGPTGGVVDVVRLTDSSGEWSSARVTVKGPGRDAGSANDAATGQDASSASHDAATRLDASMTADAPASAGGVGAIGSGGRAASPGSGGAAGTPAAGGSAPVAGGATGSLAAGAAAGEPIMSIDASITVRPHAGSGDSSSCGCRLSTRTSFSSHTELGLLFAVCFWRLRRRQSSTT